jgi:hypothetical protein
MVFLVFAQIATAVGVVGVIASMIFSGLQTRHLVQQVKIQTEVNGLSGLQAMAMLQNIQMIFVTAVPRLGSLRLIILYGFQRLRDSQRAVSRKQARRRPGQCSAIALEQFAQAAYRNRIRPAQVTVRSTIDSTLDLARIEWV